MYRKQTLTRASIVLAVCSLMMASARAQTPPNVINGETIGSPELVAAACKEGAAVFYTAQSDADERQVVKQFEKDFPCIKVSVISVLTGRLLERIQTEATAGKIQADVSLMTDEAIAQLMIEKKLVRAWTPPSEAKFPENTKKSGWWYAGSNTYLYPVYNTDLVTDAEAPKTWKDLLDPKWKGQIGSPAVAVGGTAWTLYYFMLKEEGEDYVRKFAAQQPKLFSSFQPMSMGVARGEQKIAILANVVDYPLRVIQGAPIKPIYPPEGLPYINYPMMLLNHSPHPKAGELLGNWYLSKRGQAALVGVRGINSVRSDVAPAKGNPSVSELKIWAPTNEEIIKNFSSVRAKVDGILGGR
ncbi:MAG: extracellular solute-binding protein [Rhizobiales bacterium]|nr:extracellular solute-binding protein [Hyphomicrobiales bacterium]